MLERGVLSRIIYPAPSPTYTSESFPDELVWVPKRSSLDGDPPEVGVDSVPCLLLRFPFSRFLVLYFHSNAEDLGKCRTFCDTLRQKFQVHVLAVEYPGYGICPGTACEQSVMENAMAAVHFATQTLAWPIDSIIVFGRSIGTGPALKLASQFRFSGLILITPFLSVRELFRDRIGPLADVFEDWYPNQHRATSVRCPTIIIHGQRDEMINHSHGERLYELLRSRKRLVSPEDMEHNTNLMNDAAYLLIPVTQFFALPDFVFSEMAIPSWAFDTRRCPKSLRPWGLDRKQPSSDKSSELTKLAMDWARNTLEGSALESCGLRLTQGTARMGMSCCGRACIDANETLDATVRVEVCHDPQPEVPMGALSVSSDSLVQRSVARFSRHSSPINGSPKNSLEEELVSRIPTPTAASPSRKADQQGAVNVAELSGDFDEKVESIFF